MTVAQPQPLFTEPVAGSGLMLRLDTPLPSVPAGRGTAVFVSGACFHRREPVAELELLVDGTRHRLAAARMPRLDLFRMLHPSGGPASPDDPALRSYRSGFWTTVRIEARDRSGSVDLELAARLASGTEVVAPLGRVEILEGRRPSLRPGAETKGLIAVCLATFEPDIDLFRTQIDSLRSQTDADWVCLISDDCSSPQSLDAIRETVAGDERFVVSRSPRNLGYYRNFERALELIPDEARLVALCDQDDRWHPEKLRTLRGALGAAQLVYSDQRLVDRDGRVLRPTLWSGRRNNHTNLASLLIANSITGAATLFSREVAELAVPFPDTPGWQFHDHWLGLVALASGDVAYVDRPLYDYVQHPGAILGQATRPDPSPSARARLRASLRGWRPAYFYGYLAREVLAQALLARCPAQLSARKRRTLERYVAAARQPLPFAWLAARPLRRLTGANETLGTETELVRGVLWRYLIEARARGRETPGAGALDATCPPLDAGNLGQSRLARWRARI